MTTYVALLRAVNIGRHNRVAMAQLRQMLVDLGMREVQTLLQSGNAVFQSNAATGASLERLLERAAERQLGVRTAFLVRSAADWTRIMAENPFPREAKRDPGHLLVMPLKQEPARDAVAALQGAIKGRELVRASGRCAYLVYPDGVGRSRLTSAVIERHLGTRGTGRNWNTVLKLGRLAGGH
jgi:uncharacterized protein (DUF1697 family)